MYLDVVSANGREYPFKVCSCWHPVELLDAECNGSGGLGDLNCLSLCFLSCSPYSITNFVFGNISLRVRLFLSTFCYVHSWLCIFHKSVLFTFWKVIFIGECVRWTYTYRRIVCSIWIDPIVFSVGIYNIHIEFTEQIVNFLPKWKIIFIQYELHYTINSFES